MSAACYGIDKPVEIDRKENLKDHRLYWISRSNSEHVVFCHR